MPVGEDKPHSSGLPSPPLPPLCPPGNWAVGSKIRPIDHPFRMRFATTKHNIRSQPTREPGSLPPKRRRNTQTAYRRWWLPPGSDDGACVCLPATEPHRGGLRTSIGDRPEGLEWGGRRRGRAGESGRMEGGGRRKERTERTPTGCWGCLPTTRVSDNVVVAVADIFLFIFYPSPPSR